MGVYIKGMEMPETCFECPFMFARRYCCASLTLDLYQGDYDEIKGLADGCPLVPVPTHGRLIDADALMLKILDYIEEYSDVDEKGWHNLKWCAMKEAEMAINNAPTIIPAEEGE